MMTFIRLQVLAAVGALILLTQSAFATPTGFSRACRLSELPTHTREILASPDVFNQKVNGVPLHLLDETTASQTYAWESITADYFSFPQVWLWSVSVRYATDPFSGTYSVKVYPESSWYPGSVMDNNRNWYMSVRSGSGDDLRISDIWQFTGNSYIRYGEVGGHAYWDSPAGKMHNMNNSYATDCNCLNAGFGWTQLGMPSFNGIRANIVLGILFLCKLQ